MARSLRLSGNQFHITGPATEKARRPYWDDGEARREDLGQQSEDVVWRRHWRQTGRDRLTYLQLWLKTLPVPQQIQGW